MSQKKICLNTPLSTHTLYVCTESAENGRERLTRGGAYVHRSTRRFRRRYHSSSSSSNIYYTW